MAVTRLGKRMGDTVTLFLKGGSGQPYRDEATDLRLLPALYPSLARMLRGGRPVAVLCVEVLGLTRLEKLFGRSTHSRVVTTVGGALKESAGRFLRREDLAAIGFGGSNDFMVFLSPPRDSQQFDGEQLAGVSRRVEEHVASAVERMLGDIGHPRALQVRSGYSIITSRDGETVQATVYDAVQRARGLARDQDWLVKHTMQQDVADIIQTGSISTVYQPIASLVDGQTIAYEALTRGPAGSQFEFPDRLFNVAEEAGLLYPLERLCRRSAIHYAVTMPITARLFVNISPQILEDPEFAAGVTRDMLETEGIAPSRVVLEITERHAIKDFEIFKVALEHYRRQGFSIAVDDAGAGHSSLRVVAALRPEVIKIDLSLVRDIDRDRAKHALVSALVTFAKRIDALVLAEGIETEAELNTLIEIGVPFGQGFLLGRPKPTFTTLEPQLVISIRKQIEIRDRHAAGQTISVGDIVKPVPTLSVTEKSSVAERLLQREATLQSLVVVDGNRPVGLLTREKFFAKLGSQYGYAVFGSRPIREAMNASPLLVQHDEPLEVVSRKAVHRREADAYDEILVVENDQLVGVVSVLDLLDLTSRRQVSSAKYSNPLSGLPGNVLIQTETERRLALPLPFVFCHVDLNQFKQYNDSHGFSAGDAIILLLAKVLQETVQTPETRGDFVGHIGGDDFVIITAPERIVEVGCQVVDRFSKQTRHIKPSPRDQAPPIDEPVTVSVAAITCTGDLSFDDVSETAFKAKKLAKASRGNMFVLNFETVPLGNPMSKKRLPRLRPTKTGETLETEALTA